MFFKVVLFLLVMFISSISFANDDICLDELNLHKVGIPSDLKNLSKMPHGYPCRALEFSKVLKENGTFNWWFVLTENEIQMQKDKLPVKVKVYWIVFERRE